MKRIFSILLLSILSTYWTACSEQPPTSAAIEHLFTEMPSDFTGVDFANTLNYDRDFNIYTYRNFYNGGGVALGDINNDGLLDIYLTANMLPNKLYLNKGGFVFEDITEKAGVAGTKAWATGVSMADVNGDGLLDIYVCNSGDVQGDSKQNELFINQEDGTFKEQATAYGLADQGYSTHAAFFDYDKDGDLDCYLLNNSFQAIGSFNLRKNERPIRDAVGGDKLFRNDDGLFVDVSEEAGIYGSVIGFGLGVTVGDIDQDNWPDLYISNDFFERDYLYLNNQDGTFRECLEQQMKSISAASMGADMADINNDGYPEVFVTEMLPQSEARIKTKTTFENWDRYQYNLKNDYYHQFTRNMLHLNNTDDTFSEIGRLTGVEATDWSWGALIADFDNDGNKDIFIANGIYQDLTDQDFIQYLANEETMKSMITGEGKVDFKELIKIMPSNKISNFAYANKGGLQFEEVTEEWGLATPSHSNGSAYGDLDNDGDLDLVVNNVNMPLFLYRNEADTLTDHHFLKVKLEGAAKNPFGFGAKVTVSTMGKHYYLEQMPVRGFESTVDNRPNFGLGGATLVDSLLVEWPDGKVSRLVNLPVDQTVTVSYLEAVPAQPVQKEAAHAQFFAKAQLDWNGFTHSENEYVDFDRNRLMFHMVTTEGPKMAVSDVNKDGRADFYIGGAKGSEGAVYIQQANGGFKPLYGEAFMGDRTSEDLGSLFFDANGDGYDDLFVSSGGNELSPSSSALYDRLYFNNKNGQFNKAPLGNLPGPFFESTSCVAAADFDADGDLDLFVGGRLQPFAYGANASGRLWENDGQGKFTDVTAQKAPVLLESGMFTDAQWADFDGDGDQDLAVCGEWMPIRIFLNDGGTFKEATAGWGLSGTSGWWNTLEVADLNGDGLPDLLGGNHGHNSRFRASADKPIQMYLSDFDQNGTVEQVFTQYQGNKSYPLPLRHDLVMQLPSLKKKYLKYESYQGQQVTDIFTPEQLAETTVKEVQYLSTAVLLNKGDGFTVQALPTEAQLSPIYAILVQDFDGDGNQDILLGGNLYSAKPEVGRYDASYGLMLKGDGNGNFTALSHKESGFFLDGQVRDLKVVEARGKRYILAAMNNAPVQILEWKTPPTPIVRR